MTQIEKQRQNCDEDVIKELCITNRVSYEKVSQDGSNVTSLEMFFSGYPRMVGLSLFPRLCQLTVVGQSVGLIQGLNFCPLLRELWIVECQLTEISGLETCFQLQKLYLYDNNISKIENLELLNNIQVLWLNKNCISVIEGLDTLQNLRELNLADNAIERIGHTLDPNRNLQYLNLSGNKISSFKELTYLASLPVLKELWLKEPQSCPNPVCLLCNYSTHILYHMPGLQRLDTYDVSSKQVNDATEATVRKKMMYYNMRVKSARRQLAEVQAKLLENKRRLLLQPKERIRVLSYALKNLECALSEVQALHKKSASPREDAASLMSEGLGDRSNMPTNCAQEPSQEQELLSKVGALKHRLGLWMRRLEEVETWYRQELALATERKKLTEQFLLMELETVGNIRFEEGCSTDPWFTSCCDLLLSQFCAWDYKARGIAAVKVSRVVRTHNHALRLRFEDKLHALLDSQESSVFLQNYKRRLEYLFYTSDPEYTDEGNEFLHILENGFKPADVYKALGRERAVTLSNSLSVSDGPRLDYLQNRGGTWGKQDPPTFRHGRIIVAKVFLGRSVLVREGDAVDPDNYPEAHSVYRITSQEAQEESPCSSKLHCGCECSLRHSEWFVFDNELILPEYLIDFEYVTQGGQQMMFPESGSLLQSADDSPQPPHDIGWDEETLDVEPVFLARPKMLNLDETSLLAAARANVLSQITILNLHGNSLNKLKEISRLTALRHLTISFNKFTHLDDLSHMPCLEFVDASFNRIVSLEGLRAVGRLKHMDLRWNQLTQAREETAILRKHAPALLCLDIRHNPWHRPETVRMTVLGRLKMLTHLDDLLVTEVEASIAVQIAAHSRINQASLLAHSRTDQDRPRSLSLLSAAEFLTRFRPNPWDLSAEPEPGWTLKITALFLDSQRLSQLTNLEKLVNLRWASFNDNDITKVEGLDNCQHLEELSLNDNSISMLDGVSKLRRLTRLSLNRNRLTSLDEGVLDKLPNLHFLSVESNNVGSLHGIHRARSLFEFYVSDNNIATTRDIYHLKALTNLIILDMYGNPLVEKLENYRIYMVFHLPSLKALDGVAVETLECENARDVFGGRLTLDMVAEKLGHSNYSEIADLDLQNCSLKMVDLAPVDLFFNLHSVNLEHNNLTSFSGLVYLPNIKVLCLNHNHVESILPRQKVPGALSSRQTLYHKVSSSGYGQQAPPKGSRDPAPGDSKEPLMSSLEVLHLSYNSISCMASLQLSRLINLKALFLRGNEISQVEGLEGLERLRELVLDQNRIKALGETSFTSQSMLLELHLSENRLRELNHLHPLTQLRRLFLGANKLQDLSEIEKLAVLPSLVELSVVGNPVAKRHRPVVVLRLAQLQVLDGTAITLEERTRLELNCSEAQSGLLVSGGLDVNVPSLLPLMSLAPPVRGTCLHHFLGHDLLLPCNPEEMAAQDMSRHKKHRHTVGAVAPQPRSILAELPFRLLRGASSGLPSNAQRVLVPGPEQLEHGSRLQSYSAPKPPM